MQQRGRWASYPFFILAGILAIYLSLRLIYPQLWPIRPPDPNAPTAEATLSFEEDATHGPIAGSQRRIVITDIGIRYRNQIREDQYTDVAATINQFVQIRDVQPRSSASSPADPSPLRQLESQIRMSLESPAFEFGLNGNERTVGANASLPVTLSWTPTPKYAGELALLLRLKSVPGATLTINGERQRISGNDDIPLPVKVDNAGGLPRFWWFWLTVAGTVLMAVIGSAIQIYSAWKT